jgi:hypothetical protein
MKPIAFDQQQPDVPDAPPSRRRSLLLGAGVAGVAAIAARALPVAPAELAQAAAQATAPDQGGGYQLTQHVLRYYETTRI